MCSLNKNTSYSVLGSRSIAWRTGQYLKARLQRLGATPGDTLVVAVSGGRDSMVLLHLLKIFAEQEYSLQVLHVNHRLRGKESDADADLVQEFCLKNKLAVHLHCLQPPELQSSLGLEAAAREARYRVFTLFRQKFYGAKILTAHHREDQLETILMRLHRGAGIRGLRGILDVRSDGVLRPLLGVGRKRLEACALQLGSPWREDSSNSELRFYRNWVRHSVVPDIHDYLQPEQLFRLRNMAKRAWTRLEEKLCKKWPLPTLNLRQGRVEIDLVSLQEIAAQRSLWHCWWQVFEQKNQEITPARASCLESLRRLVIRGRGICDLGNSCQARASAGILFLQNMAIESVQASDANSYLVQERTFACPSDISAMPENTEFQAFLDANRVPKGWVLRRRQSGDLFSPPGLQSTTRKLKEYLRECAVPHWQRDTLLLVAQGSRVLWIPGLAVSGLHRPGAGTITLLELRLTWKNKSP